MVETPGKLADLQTRIAALRASGAERDDPVRFAYLVALTRRIASQPEAVRQLLIAKTAALAVELAARPTPPHAASPETAAPSPLADLLAYISQHALVQSAATQTATASVAVNRNFRPISQNAPAGRNPPAQELKSVAYFRHTWSRLSTEQQLTQTLAQAPANAGPMNSQHLVLRSLETMRDISPDYLQGFMSYIDALIWLDHADPTRPTSSRLVSGEGEKKRKTKKRAVISG
jgi:hypothetical protein